MRRFGWLALLLLILPGCAFTTHLAHSVPVGSTPRPLIATSAPPSTGTPIVAENCTPRDDWELYIVRAGDTLGALAQRTGSTIPALMTANCIENPDRVLADQPIRVPRPPDPLPTAPPVTPTPVVCPPLPPTNNAGRPLISSYVAFDATCYHLRAGTTVNVVWFEAPTGGSSVTFYFQPQGGDASDIIPIGTDTYLADGAALTWAVGALPFGYLYAVVEPSGAQSDVIGVYAD